MNLLVSLSQTCAVALAAALIVACGPPTIDKTLTAGSYDGFTIGDSAAQVYGRLQAKAGSKNLPFSSGCYLAGSDSSVLARVEPQSKVWQGWAVFGRTGAGVDTLYANFSNDTVVGSSIEGLKGLGYDSAFARLAALVRPAYDSLEFRLLRKDLKKPYATCMADTAFQPRGGNAVKTWSLVFKSECEVDELKLDLRGGALLRLQRLRVCFRGI